MYIGFSTVYGSYTSTKGPGVVSLDDKEELERMKERRGKKAVDVVLLEISSGHREATTPMATSGQGKLYSWSRGHVQEEHTHTKTESSSGFYSNSGDS